MDTKAIPIIKKKVQPIARQDEFESRRLWKEVTLALRNQDVTMATSSKQSIEQRQRDLVKERLQSGAKWETKVTRRTIGFKNTTKFLTVFKGFKSN